MRGRVLTAGLLAVGVACASTGPVRTGPNEFMLTRTAIGDTWSDGSRVLAGLYVEANEHCAKEGRVVEGIEDENSDGRVFVRNASATLRFRCVPAE